MGLLNIIKRPKYGYTPEEMEKKLKEALVLREQKSPLEEAIEEAEREAPPRVVSAFIKKRPKTVPKIDPSEKSVFMVSDSFKLLPLFVINGTAVSGVLQKGMVAMFEGEAIEIKAIQEGLQKTQKLYRGNKGSLEIVTKMGLDIPANTPLVFVPKSALKKKPKRKRAKRRKKINPKETEVTLAVPRAIKIVPPVAVPVEIKRQ
jgi:hypothetical protein